jgi:hypothetical protein
LFACPIPLPRTSAPSAALSAIAVGVAFGLNALLADLLGGDQPNGLRLKRYTVTETLTRRSEFGAD